MSMITSFGSLNTGDYFRTKDDGVLCIKIVSGTSDGVTLYSSTKNAVVAEGPTSGLPLWYNDTETVICVGRVPPTGPDLFAAGTRAVLNYYNASLTLGSIGDRIDRVRRDLCDRHIYPEHRTPADTEMLGEESALDLATALEMLRGDKVGRDNLLSLLVEEIIEQIPYSYDTLRALERFASDGVARVMEAASIDYDDDLTPDDCEALKEVPRHDA